MIYFFIRAIQNHKVYEKKAFAYEPDEAEKIIFQFCSRDAPQIVYDAIKRVHDSCRPLGYEKYQVDLITDTKIPKKSQRKSKQKSWLFRPTTKQTHPQNTRQEHSNTP
jgi:hypothetical protein